LTFWRTAGPWMRATLPEAATEAFWITGM
jgi:hypothetical protein